MEPMFEAGRLSLIEQTSLEIQYASLEIQQASLTAQQSGNGASRSRYQIPPAEETREDAMDGIIITREDEWDEYIPTKEEVDELTEISIPRVYEYKSRRDFLFDRLLFTHKFKADAALAGWFETRMPGFNWAAQEAPEFMWMDWAKYALLGSTRRDSVRIEIGDPYPMMVGSTVLGHLIPTKVARSYLINA